MTTDASGALVAAKEAPNPNLTMLVLLVFVQVLYVCLVYGPIAAYLIEAFPGKDPVHVAVAALSHRKWGVRGIAAADRPVVGCGDGEYLCGTLLSDDCRWHDIHRRKCAVARDTRCEDLG